MARIEVLPDASGLKVALVVSRFNELVTRRLSEGAVSALLSKGAVESDIDILSVPGAFEIPPVALKAVRSGRYDAVACLGCVIRGETPHFDYVCSETSRGIMQAGLELRCGVGFGLLTVDTLEQALARSGSDTGNKGADTVLAAVEMTRLFKKMDGIH